jgi:DNA polymerase-4
MDTKRCIVHMDLDTFFVSVERLLDSSLVGKPVLVGGAAGRGVVASCSYEARKFGIHSAMPMRTALQLCPEAVVVQGSYEKYSEKSREVTDIIRESVPLFEKSSVDEFYIDLTGMDRFFGCFKIAHELRQKIIRESGLNISMGISANKTVSKVATGESKPNNERLVPLGEERSFLAPLSVKKIPMIGKTTTLKLQNMGISKVLELQQMPVELLESAFGKHGKMIWEKANGIDHAPIIPYSEVKSVSTENTFGRDTLDGKKLETTLITMTEQLSSTLRRRQQMTSCVSVKIRYSDFDTHTIQHRIPYTCADHTLIPIVKELFRKLDDGHLPIRLIGVRLSSLVHGNYQIKLFEDTEERINLYQALDRLNVKYGAKTVCRAVGMGIDRRRFNPFNGMEI